MDVFFGAKRMNELQKKVIAYIKNLMKCETCAAFDEHRYSCEIICNNFSAYDWYSDMLCYDGKGFGCIYWSPKNE